KEFFLPVGMFIKKISAASSTLSNACCWSLFLVFCSSVTLLKEDNLSSTLFRHSAKSACGRSSIIVPQNRPVSIESASTKQEKQYLVIKANLSISCSLLLQSLPINSASFLKSASEISGSFISSL